jgi:nicotinate (nicotinamide) nucleotide adenylyltransferase
MARYVPEKELIIVSMTKKRIGIFAGAFDPIHAGHLAFALLALKEAKLDHVYFLPERRPRYKPDIEHFGHRTAMITRAIRPYKKLSLLELPDIFFDSKRTLKKLQHEFSGMQLVMLMGSDSALRLPDWPDVSRLLKVSELVIAVRAEHDRSDIVARLKPLVEHTKVCYVDPLGDHISSSHIRYAFRHNQPAAGLLASVQRYAIANWLYVSVANAKQ